MITIKLSKKKAVLFLVIAALLITAIFSYNAYYPRSIAFSGGQEAAMSPEAAAVFKEFKMSQVPPFVRFTEDRVLDMRKDFEASETEVEDSIIEKYGLKLEETTIADVPVLIVTPQNIKPGYEDTIAINIHGGSFVMGTARDRTALLMAEELGMRVYSIEYTLAPEAKYPVAINESLEVYNQLTAEYDPQRIVGISSSAGGNLMLAMLLKAQELKLPMIRAIALFTPAADISRTGDSYEFNNGRDSLNGIVGLKVAYKHYVGDADIKDPLVSPIYGEYKESFPATIINTGTRDLMLSNSIRLFWKLKDVNVPAELLVSEGMWHGFNWYYELPEAIKAQQAVGAFLNQQLSKDHPQAQL